MKLTTIEYQRDPRLNFEGNVLAALAEGRIVAVSLDHVASIEYDDIRRLIKLLRRTRDIGTEFALSANRPDIRRMLAATALDAVFTVMGSDAA